MKTSEEAIQTIERSGFRACTKVASEQDGIAYLSACEECGEERGARYCCVSEEDLFALLALVEASNLQPKRA
jgi:hypothetical protein